MSSPVLFTTSWDDGHPLDFRVADVLERYGAKGTFYICQAGYGGQSLAPADIRALAARQEIGAHTLTHPRLPTLSPEDMVAEIGGSKAWLEEIVSAECALFAYPFGAYDERSRKAVQHAGFRAARTTEDLTWDVQDSFLIPTSVQVHSFPFRRVSNRRFVQPVQRLWPRLRACGLPLVSYRGWLPMAKAAFLHAQQQPVPWFHLWGHSWSLESLSLWEPFEEFLAFVAEHSVEHVTNHELFTRLDALDAE